MFPNCQSPLHNHLLAPSLSVSLSPPSHRKLISTHKHKCRLWGLVCHRHFLLVGFQLCPALPWRHSDQFSSQSSRKAQRPKKKKKHTHSRVKQAGRAEREVKVGGSRQRKRGQSETTHIPRRAGHRGRHTHAAITGIVTAERLQGKYCVQWCVKTVYLCVCVLKIGCYLAHTWMVFLCEETINVIHRWAGSAHRINIR